MVENVNLASRRSYGQFCGLARALDIVGDRWNLLIVRELLPGPLRYSDLKASCRAWRATSWPNGCGRWRRPASWSEHWETQASSMD